MFAYILGLYLYIFVTRLRRIGTLRDRMARLAERWRREPSTAPPTPWEERMSRKVKQE